jgi:hypothetical protein
MFPYRGISLGCIVFPSRTENNEYMHRSSVLALTLVVKRRVSRHGRQIGLL